MNDDRIRRLLTEMVDSQGFININQCDIDRFLSDVKTYDAEKISGSIEEVGVMINNAISSLLMRNRNKIIRSLLFVIRISHQSAFIEYINNVQDFIDTLDGDVKCQWGISTIDGLQDNQLELIVLVGF